MKPWNIIIFLDTLRSVLRNLGVIFYNKDNIGLWTKKIGNDLDVNYI